ncbi:unnamed protein product [Chrysoparadoxa australica]
MKALSQGTVWQQDPLWSCLGHVIGDYGERFELHQATKWCPTKLSPKVSQCFQAHVSAIRCGPYNELCEKQERAITGCITGSNPLSLTSDGLDEVSCTVTLKDLCNMMKSHYTWMDDQGMSEEYLFALCQRMSHVITVQGNVARGNAKVSAVASSAPPAMRRTLILRGGAYRNGHEPCLRKKLLHDHFAKVGAVAGVFCNNKDCTIMTGDEDKELYFIVFAECSGLFQALLCDHHSLGSDVVVKALDVCTYCKNAGHAANSCGDKRTAELMDL